MITPDQLRKCATCVYLAAEAGPAEDIAKHLNLAAQTIEDLQRWIEAAQERFKMADSLLTRWRRIDYVIKFDPHLLEDTQNFQDPSSTPTPGSEGGEMSIREDMDKQLAAKSRLTPGKVCGACREPKQHTEDCSAVLKAELAAKDALLGAAVEAVKAPTHEANDYNCQDWPPGQGCRGCDGDELRKTFLSRPEIKVLMKEGG